MSWPVFSPQQVSSWPMEDIPTNAITQVKCKGTHRSLMATAIYLSQTVWLGPAQVSELIGQAGARGCPVGFTGGHCPSPMLYRGFWRSCDALLHPNPISKSHWTVWPNPKGLPPGPPGAVLCPLPGFCTLVCQSSLHGLSATTAKDRGLQGRTCSSSPGPHL